MTHRERIEALLKGEKPDRMPVSFWRHFYDSESTPEQLASAMITFQEKFDWDLMKINPRASYYPEAWGSEYAYTGGPDGHPKRISYAVKSSSDWQKIARLDPLKEKALSDHIEAVKMIKNMAPPTLPIIMTVFNPISIAGDLVDNDIFLVNQIRSNPGPLHEALENITLTFIDAAKEFVKAGADGIFFATTQWASTNLINEEEYLEFGFEYDMQFLEEVIPNTSVNVLHVCSSNNMLPLFADYPIRIVNWDMNHKSNPDMEKGAGILKDKVILGGVDRNGLLQNGTKQELEAIVEHYDEFAKRHPFMLGPDCSIPTVTPNENLAIIKSKVEEMAL